jgi:gas vesicle protein
MRNLNNSENLLVGIAIGALSGAALGVLFAPSEGRKTRDKIVKDVNKFGNEILDKVNSETENLKSKANKFLHASEEEAKEMKSKAQSKANEASKMADKAKDEVKSEAKDTAEIAAKSNKRGDA